jgi:hypothetical protein
MASNFGVSDRPSFRNPNEQSTTPSFNDGYDPKLSRKVGMDVVLGGIKSNDAQAAFSKYGGKESKKSNRQLQVPTTFGYSDGPKDYNLSLHNKSNVRHFGSGAPAPEFMNLPTSDEVASPFRQEEELAEKKISRKKYDRKDARATRLDERSFKKDEKKFNSGAKLRRKAGKIRRNLNINNVKD